MKKLVGVIMVATFVVGLSGTALGGPRWGINRRERSQQQRIFRGIRSGELTRFEAARLEAEQARIRIHERIARSDGTLTPRERARLERELNRARRDIHRQTHDNDHRLR
ncbi:MAG TPA: hypothetical protein VJH03_00765 [Blastocatellia bacterium]|nr:hypothetical protein [Blastocatellia bacterium]